MSVVHLVAVIPTYGIADGEFDDVAVGRLHAFGFGLQVTSTVPADTRAREVSQNADSIPITTITGTVVPPTDQAPPDLDDGQVRPLLASRDDPWEAGDAVSVTGRLVVEPYLWATDGRLWPLVPDAVRLWSVERIRRVGDEEIETIEALPGADGLDHDSTYLVDLAAT